MKLKEWRAMDIAAVGLWAYIASSGGWWGVSSVVLTAVAFSIPPRKALPPLPDHCYPPGARVLDS